MPELPKAVDAERIAFSGRAGELSYYVAGEGPPMLLTHSINAAGFPGARPEPAPVAQHGANLI